MNGERDLPMDGFDFSFFLVLGSFLVMHVFQRFYIMPFISDISNVKIHTLHHAKQQQKAAQFYNPNNSSE